MSVYFQRQGIIEVDVDLLVRLLGLSDGHDILAVKELDFGAHNLLVLIDGPMMPVTPVGSRPPRCDLICTTKETGEMTPVRIVDVEVRRRDGA